MIRLGGRFSVACAMIAFMWLSTLQVYAKKVKDPVEYAVEIVSVQFEGGRGREEFHATRDGKSYKLVGLPKDFKKGYVEKMNAIKQKAAAKALKLKAAKTKPSLSGKEAKLAARKLVRLAKDKSKPRIKISNFDIAGATITLTSDSTLALTEDANAVETVAAAGIAYGTVTGEASVLVIRITGADVSTTASAAQLSDEVFGTDGDPINLKTQYNTVSYGKKTFVPASGSAKIVNGVIEVTIGETVSGATSGTIVNAAKAAAEAKLGHSLSGNYDHVMYAIPPGTAGGSWLAYGSVGGYYSVYNDNWVLRVSAQMHEVGHNLGLAHSGEGTDEYGDQQGMMGYSYNWDDTPVMGFNAARSSRLTWYNDKEITVSSNWAGQVIGFANYGDATASQNVIIKVADVDSKVLYITYNRATGMNAGTKEAANKVTVVEKTGTGYAQSYLLAKLNTTDNKTFTRSNFKGTGNDLVVTFVSTATANGVQYANVTITFDGSSNVAPEITEGTSKSVTMSEDGSPTAFSLTLHATDANGDTLTWSISSGASKGTASASGNGTSKAITYTPNANYYGPDSFEVQVSDGNGGTDTITVNVTVQSVNDAPVAQADAYHVDEDNTLVVNAANGVLDNDSDVDSSIDAVLVTDVDFGSLVLNDDGSFTYIPGSEFNGDDEFTYYATDGLLNSSTVTVTLTVDPINDPPVAYDQSVTVTKDKAEAILLTGYDADGDSLSYYKLTDPTNGRLSGTLPNVTYTPDPGYVGPDSFTFRVRDGSVYSGAATVTITVKKQAFYYADSDDGCAMGGDSKTPIAWYLPLLFAGAIIAVLQRRRSKGKA